MIEMTHRMYSRWNIEHGWATTRASERFAPPYPHLSKPPQQGVVIHKVHRMGNSYYSALMTHAGQQYNELTEGTEWVHFVGIDEDGHFQYIRVKVSLAGRIR